jgi:hypothetical protein
MDESTEELQRIIAAKHEELDNNLSALDTKAKELTDWRAQFDQRPLVVLGAAFAGGVVVAALLGGSRSRRRDTNDYRPRYQPASASSPSVEGPWHGLRGAVGAVAASAVLELITKAAPGLKEHLIDPIRAQMTREGGGAAAHQRSSAFAAPHAARTNGYSAPDAT